MIARQDIICFLVKAVMTLGNSEDPYKSVPLGLLMAIWPARAIDVYGPNLRPGLAALFGICTGCLAFSWSLDFQLLNYPPEGCSISEGTEAYMKLRHQSSFKTTPLPHTQNILWSFRLESLEIVQLIFYWQLAMSSCGVVEEKRPWHPEQVVKSQLCHLLDVLS